MRRFALVLVILMLVVATVAQDQTLLPHGGIVTSAAWNQAETQILTASEDGRVRIWDAASGELVQELDHDAPVRWIMDDTGVLSWTSDGTVTVWQDGAVLRSTSGDSPIRGAIWREGAVLLWDDSGSVRLWTDDSTREFHHDVYVRDVAWRDQRLMTLEMNGQAHIWDTASGEELRTMTFGDEVLGFAWSDDADRMLVWGGGGAVRLYDISGDNEQLVETFAHLSFVDGAAWNNDKRLVETFAHLSFVDGAAWNNDETRILSWGADDTVRLWDAQTGDRLLSLLHQDWVTGAALSADETRILSWSFNTVWLWDATGTTPLATFTHDSLVTGAAWNADETQILSWSWDGTARVWAMP